MPEIPENSTPVSVVDRILDAAEQVVARDGVRNLTLEAVAHEAGVSKGGLLYHFPTKSALITAIVERHARLREAAQAAAMAADPGGPGAFTRAYVRARAMPLDFRVGPFHTAMLAALGTDPQLLDPIRRCCREWQARLESDGLDPATASIVRLAVDGLFLCQIMGVPVPEGDLRQRVIEKLLSMAQATGEERQR